MEELKTKLKTYRIPRVRISLIRESYADSPLKRITNSKDCVSFLHSELDDLDREHFLTLYLDSKNNILDIETVSIGSLSTSVVHPREVMTGAILRKAAGLIFAHNHISSDPSPSREDRDCTERLLSAGRLLGIRVLDHLVIGSFGDYYSFADAGLMQEPAQFPPQNSTAGVPQ